MSGEPVIDTIEVRISEATILRAWTSERARVVGYVSSESILGQLLADAMEVKTPQLTLAGVIEAIEGQRKCRLLQRWFDNEYTEHGFIFGFERTSP